VITCFHRPMLSDVFHCLPCTNASYSDPIIDHRSSSFRTISLISIPGHFQKAEPRGATEGRRRAAPFGASGATRVELIFFRLTPQILTGYINTWTYTLCIFNYVKQPRLKGCRISHINEKNMSVMSMVLWSSRGSPGVMDHSRSCPENKM
jgi:hypothetical protein